MQTKVVLSLVPPSSLPPSLPPEYLCHVYVRNDSLSAVVIADSEYPQRVGFTLLDKVGAETSPPRLPLRSITLGSCSSQGFFCLKGVCSLMQLPRRAWS